MSLADTLNKVGLLQQSLVNFLKELGHRMQCLVINMDKLGFPMQRLVNNVVKIGLRRCYMMAFMDTVGLNTWVETASQRGNYMMVVVAALARFLNMMWGEVEREKECHDFEWMACGVSRQVAWTPKANCQIFHRRQRQCNLEIGFTWAPRWWKTSAVLRDGGGNGLSERPRSSTRIGSIAVRCSASRLCRSFQMNFEKPGSNGLSNVASRCSSKRCRRWNNRLWSQTEFCPPPQSSTGCWCGFNQVERWSRRKTTALEPADSDLQGQGHQRDCSRDQKLAKALWAGSGGGCNSPWRSSSFEGPWCATTSTWTTWSSGGFPIESESDASSPRSTANPWKLVGFLTVPVGQSKDVGLGANINHLYENNGAPEDQAAGRRCEVPCKSFWWRPQGETNSYGWQTMSLLPVRHGL